MIRVVPYLAVFAILAGCTPKPMTLDQAQRVCHEELARSDGVSGTVGVGVGSGGPVARAKINVNVTNRTLSGQTDGEFLADCISRRVNGKAPPPTVGVSVGAGS